MSKRPSYDAGLTNVRKSARLNLLDVFPNYCYFCKHVRKRVANNIESCHLLTKPESETLLHDAIHFHNDQQLLLYIDNEISLRDRKFQMHKSCYHKYVKPVRGYSSRKIDEPEENPCVGQTTSENNDFDKVSKYIEENIIGGTKESVSIAHLHELYADGHAGDRRFRGKLKSRIVKNFGQQVKFLSEAVKTPEIIVSGEESAMTNTSKRNIINLAADYIRQDILDMNNEVSRNSWPPTMDELEKIEAMTPTSITDFYSRLLHPGKKHQIPEPTKVLVNSFSSDLLSAVSKGNILTKKHFILGMGLHNMTGQKAPVKVISNLGHCDSYLNVCTNETGQALVAQKELKDGKLLKIQPNEGSFVNTIFWADNFNMAHDTMGKNAFIDITHVVAFQELNSESFTTEYSSSLSHEECKISKLEVIPIDDVIVDKRAKPSTLLCSNSLDTEDKFIKWRVYTWIVLRVLSAEDQSFPSLSAWCIRLRSQSNTNIKKTEETYLPPLPTSITSFGTLQKLFKILQDSAKSVNMPYVNLTLDVGAAINAFKLLWNDPLTFPNIMIHLGDFHLMKENFGVIGLFIKNSGFEDIVFQSRLCNSGCLNGILSGGHYNRCWGVHSCFYEALERLLFDLFKHMYDTSLPEELNAFLEDENKVPNLSSLPELCDFFMRYENFKQDVRTGKYGKTAQFWLLYYLDIMLNQHMMHTAVQGNDFDSRLSSWKFMLPYFFATNRINYSRFGAYYVFSLENIDSLYPGNKDFLKENGLSIQAQSRYDLRTPVDQRGEQTINREAKVAGGLKLLRPDDKLMLKWTLNRAKQAENTMALKEYANIKGSEEIYKHLRPSMILQSEKNVQRVLDVLQNEYLNPFDPTLDKSRLYNLSSGVAVSTETDDEILSVIGSGKLAYQEFVAARFQPDGNGSIHDTIKRQKYASFSGTSNHVTVIKCGKHKTIEANRDVLGKLIATSSKHNRPIDMEKALSYQLTAVPLSLAHPDGSRRTTSKSQLIDVIKRFNQGICVLPSSNEVSAYIIDFIALVRTVSGGVLPETFKELFDVLLSKIPAGYKRVDIIVDAYLDKSFKNEERARRGVSDKVIVASEHSRLPRNFNNFLSNGENKSQLAELMLKVILNERVRILSLLSTNVIYISSYNKCIRISMSESSEAYHLTSNQEEADTKLMLHASDALSTDSVSKVIIRSHSGDTDILIISLGLFIEEAHRVFLDSNTGKNRLTLNLGNISMSIQQKECLIPLHALSGNDYVSSFFRRTKIRCWDTIQANHKFCDIVSALGNSWEVSEELSENIEEYVCSLYGKKMRKVNNVRNSLFQNKLKKGGKIIDLSLSYHHVKLCCVFIFNVQI